MRGSVSFKPLINDRLKAVRLFCISLLLFIGVNILGCDRMISSSFKVYESLPSDKEFFARFNVISQFVI